MGLVTRPEEEYLPLPRCQQQPDRNTSPPSNQEVNTTESGVGTSNGSPYISVGSSSMHLVDALGDGVGRLGHPQALAFVGLPPFQGPRRPHERAEHRREDGGVEDDQSHPTSHGVGDSLGHRVLDLVLGDVTPPDEDVGLLEDVPRSGRALGPGASPSPSRSRGRRARRRWFRGCRRGRYRRRRRPSCSWTFSFQTVTVGAIPEGGRSPKRVPVAATEDGGVAGQTGVGIGRGPDRQSPVRSSPWNPRFRPSGRRTPPSGRGSRRESPGRAVPRPSSRRTSRCSPRRRWSRGRRT